MDSCTELRIEKASAEDIEDIAGIESATSNEPWSRGSLLHDICSSDIAYVAAAKLASCEGNITAGYADMWLVAGEAQLNNIAVLPDLRGRGYGSALLGHMIRTAHDKGSDCMTLEVRTGNGPAIAMYRGAGFKEDGIRHAYYEDNGEDALLMSIRW